MMMTERLVGYAMHEAAQPERADILRIADAIERELAERYVKLPLDADGVPIHIGDEVTFTNGDRSFTRTVQAIGKTWVVFGDATFYGVRSCHHHKPTLEDVLRELLQRYDTLRLGPEAFDPFELVDEYADKVREVVE